MASLIHSRKKILSNFQLKECQTKYKQSDPDSLSTSFFPLTSLKIDNNGMITGVNYTKQQRQQERKDLQPLAKKQITDNSNSYSRRKQSYFEESTIQQSDLILKKSISQLNISKIQRTLEESFLSPRISNEQSSSYPSPILEGIKDKILESQSLDDQCEDINNLSAIPSLNKEQQNKQVLPKILNYKDFLSLKKARKEKFQFNDQEINQTSISKISHISYKDSMPSINQKGVNRNDNNIKDHQNDYFYKNEESLDNLDLLKNYMLKQPINNSYNILPIISQNQYYTNSELALMKSNDSKKKLFQKKNERVQNQIKKITNNQNDFLIDQYLIKLNQQNQSSDQQSKDIGNFFKNIENNKRKDEDESSRKLQNSKPKIVNRVSIIQTYNDMDDDDKDKVKRIYHGISEIIKYIQKLNNSGQDRNYNIKIFKKLIHQKKCLSQLFLNEAENDFVNPLTLDQLEKKIIFKEQSVINQQITVENKYNLALLKDIEDLAVRFKQYFLDQKILAIDQIEENIVKEQKIVLNKAQKLEFQNRLEPSFFAYNCIKKLSSESISMLQKNDITSSINEAIKGDHSITKYFKEGNIQMYNNISRNITQLHRKLVESRRNIFFFK